MITRLSQMAAVFFTASHVNAEDKLVRPPETGKFFYVDFPQHGFHGQHAITVKIRAKDSDEWIPYPLYFTSQN